MKVKRKLLKEHLKKHGLTAAELAGRMGIVPTEIGKLLKGEAVGIETARLFIVGLSVEDAVKLIDWDAMRAELGGRPVFIRTDRPDDDNNSGSGSFADEDGYAGNNEDFDGYDGEDGDYVDEFDDEDDETYDNLERIYEKLKRFLI